MKNRLPLSITYIVAILAMLFWSFAFIWVKQVYSFGLRPITVVFLRLVIASIVLCVISKFLRKEEKILKKDHKWFFLVAFCEPFCYFLGESFGMLFVSSTLASIIVSTIPLLTPFFAWFFLKENVTKFEIIGLVVSFTGVLFLVAEDLQLGGSLLGVFLMFIAVFSGTAYGIILRKLTYSYSPLTITRIQTIIGMLLFLPLFLFIELKYVTGTGISLEALKFILLLGFLPSSFSFLFLAISVKRIGIVRTNIFSNLIPVFTGILAFYFLSESFSLLKVFAMFVVVGGLFVSQYDNLRKILNKRRSFKLVKKTA